VARLSILIFADDGAEPLERTLVSVLQNRPDACEVIVVTHGDYDDPYQLAEEVRFLAAPRTAGPTERIEYGLRQCRAPVVHVLRAGVEATDRWTDAALAHFDDARVAAVAPLVVDANDPRRVVSAGLDYRRGGRQIVRAAGKSVDCLAGAAEIIVGPALSAAFYRLEALERCGGDFDLRLDVELAGVEWALALRQRGYVARFEPSSRLLAEAEPRGATAPARSAWQSERLFWRYAGAMGWTRSLAAHLVVVAAECLGHWRSPQVAVSRLAGRLIGCAGAMAGRQPGGGKSSIGKAASKQPTTVQSASPPAMHRTDAGAPATPAPHRETPAHNPQKTNREACAPRV
jgi:Glycosyl transferase family 2